MAGHELSLDDETEQIATRRAQEEGLDQSTYIARLVRRDDRQRRLAADSAALNAAGFTPDRHTPLAAHLIAERRTRAAS